MVSVKHWLTQNTPHHLSTGNVVIKMYQCIPVDEEDSKYV